MCLSNDVISILRDECQQLDQLHLLHCKGLTIPVFSLPAALPPWKELSIDIDWYDGLRFVIGGGGLINSVAYANGMAWTWLGLGTIYQALGLGMPSNEFNRTVILPLPSQTGDDDNDSNDDDVLL